MENFEKMGVFYLGRQYDQTKNAPKDDLFLFDSKNLTTHAVCLGMTGSGKTGLGIALLEEAAIDKIPALIIDPKGDLPNLLLTFPQLSAQEFKPWVDPAEADRKGESVDALAAETAKTWSEGLKASGQDHDRIAKLRESAEVVVYTPASKAGIQLSVLSSFAAPSQEVLLDPGAFRERVLSTTSSLLGLLGIQADPLKSREHILISAILDKMWSQGKNLDIVGLIQQVQKPPFDKIGVLDMETFFPAKERQTLSITLNNLLASPGFQAWMEGDPLDIQDMLYTEDGKPKLAILSIAHLTDSERMFIVTLVLNEFLSWMRRQPGTSSLRAILYMDEIFGYFPPTAMPPSKLPMLTLLKQARAFGVGVVLCTQNPVDLDYKGLSNCGTWFIGKLQTERDRARVVEGLQASSNGEIDTNSLQKLLANSGKRTFILRSIYEKEPLLFQTRWTMSYLRGPMTLPQINSLMSKEKSTQPAATKAPVEEPAEPTSTEKPFVPQGITEYFIRPENVRDHYSYSPKVLGMGKLHFVDTKVKVDVWQETLLLAYLDDDGKEPLWDESDRDPTLKSRIEKTPSVKGDFEHLPAALMQEKNYANFEKSFSAYLYQTQSLTLYKATEFGLTSNPGESEGDFKVRVSLTLRDKRDEAVNKLRDKYKDKINLLTEKIRKAQDKVETKQQQAGLQKAEALISFGTTVLGALFGKGVTKTTINNAGTTIRRAGRISKESSSATQAEEGLENYKSQLEDLHDQMEKDVTNLTAGFDLDKITVDTIEIKPRKTDISVDKVVLAWDPR